MTLSVCGLSNAQVAINNINPQGTFHVDGAKDNPATGSLTTAQQANDFVVKADGKVGIGTTTPQTKLDIATSANSVGLQHTDGTIRLQTFLGRGTTNGNTDAGWLGTSTNHPLDFMTNNAFRVRITTGGNVGIGTTDPQARLHISTSTVKEGFQLQDGSQGAGKILTSDAQGKASWNVFPAITQTVLGTANTVEKQVAANTLINSTLTLPTGKWLVYIGQLVKAQEVATADKNFWMRISLSSSNTSYTSSGFSFLGSSLVSGYTTMSGVYSFLQGVIPVHITAANTTLYTWFTLCDTGTAGKPSSVSIGNNSENYLFAVPIS
ncbi:hypothetical protein ACR1PO_03315 [Chryseobacterium sp. RRHN12]|uniref:hypothetical protein n=1 Tax=Chryseobacterium sp. RRHN12 TaxID=3437884 RepID=UPI003D9BA367